jgi:hypothetical protein
MNGCKRFFKILSIDDKELFVLSGEIDTYIFMLFIKNMIYLVLIMFIVNAPILLPLFKTGKTADECNNFHTNNNTGVIVLSPI